MAIFRSLLRRDDNFDQVTSVLSSRRRRDLLFAIETSYCKYNWLDDVYGLVNA